MTWTLMALLVACAPNEDEVEDSELVGSTQAIIYGDDDRLEVYQHPDPVLRGLAESSSVALISRTRFGKTASGDFAIASLSLADSFNICPDQRFSAEPAAADCSGVLIDDDLVLTAAHCFKDDAACTRYAFVFDYYLRDNRALQLGWGDIYGCRRVVSRVLDNPNAVPRIDYAVVQLDRKPVGRVPVPVRSAPLLEGESLAVIGSVSGLPLKIDSGGRLLSARAPTLDYFVLSSDTFQGSSGSGVFDRGGQLAGVLVRGGEDYVDIADGGCRVPNVVSEPSGDSGVLPKLAADGGMVTFDGEEATYAARVVEGVCASGWPSTRLCSTSARCGDGFCSLGETREVCPSDCACAYGACVDGGNLPAATSGAIDKSRHHDEGCSALPGRPASASGLWLTLLAGIGVWRRRALARKRHARRDDPLSS